MIWSNWALECLSEIRDHHHDVANMANDATKNMRKAWEEVEAKQARFAQYQRADIESGEGKGKTRAWGFVVDELEENGEPSAKRRRKSPSSWRSDFSKLTLSDFNGLSPKSC